MTAIAPSVLIPVTTDPQAPTSEKIQHAKKAQTDHRVKVKTAYPVRQNTVTTVGLNGVNIVALRIDNKERLCLAQISSTLLKKYSYNEIHNRRVALGITCVQCTPVQLEILRRAGAMPISSRRCGMITKREAERLVKSFLEENNPPKLPDNFSFDIEHRCGWGCRGQFVPTRYNSSRAKCIRCAFCNMYFSPNKFIFHFHRMPESKYTHPDAANFNSWRRHVILYGEPSEDLIHLWEDVKAMFNGGSRKRILSSVCSRMPSYGEEAKKPRTVMAKGGNSDLLSTPYHAIYNPVKNSYPIAPLATHSHYLTYPYEKKINTGTEQRLSYGWSGVEPNSNRSNPYELFWPTIGMGHKSPTAMAISGFNFGLGVRKHCKPVAGADVGSFENDREPINVNTTIANSGHSSLQSAFTPVGRHISPVSTVSVVSPRPMDDSRSLTECDDDEANQNLDTDNIEIDVTSDVSSDDGRNSATNISNDVEESKCVHEGCNRNQNSPETFTARYKDGGIEEMNAKLSHSSDKDSNTSTKEASYGTEKHEINELKCDKKMADVELPTRNDIDQQQQTIDTEVTELTVYVGRNQSPFSQFTKEELVKILEKEIEKARECDNEVHIMKENLYHELDQERKARFNLQQKLKEAHDALHSFSCKMLASRHCSECLYRTALLKDATSQLPGTIE